MIALAAALLAAATAAALPEVDARYRVEIGGEAVGWARLALHCQADGCRGRWESELRAPAEAGGGVIGWLAELDTAPGGEARAVRVRIAADGRERRRAQGPGPIPASLAELVLARARDGEERCVRVRDEESGEEGEACARRVGGWLEGRVLGAPLRYRAAPGAAPDEVLLAAQATRFVRDAEARLPAAAPRVSGAALPRPRDAAALCGVPRDPASGAAPPAVPRSWPPGESCRERTARYLALAARAGWRGRHAVGVAYDGRALVWHEWAELLVEGRWVPVDPSFEQAPAEGPRFTLGRFEEGDDRARASAGRALAACWLAGG
ncbi:transglutaminase domain-containing protein [Anaeromyxobacter diazotrophicus]|uniref:Transglutaminase-like domain-containing protein n=1 Tax=Anaeromyxobacter diazotrophicus TaxID=2590199 RepID=A0A7I9VR92_9BACT|nr:transglutaminase domain-containing protein [Anaeromyxobacter diazotrophicus]GEJ58599.1 hypothetical protein AMYX_33400 [Anaeromyxobacter diazotrophicus]